MPRKFWKSRQRPFDSGTGWENFRRNEPKAEYGCLRAKTSSFWRRNGGGSAKGRIRWYKMKFNEDSVVGLLRDLERQKFFGSLDLKFESGQLVLMRKTETLKPNDCREALGEKKYEYKRE